jgi:hypothetical protein
MRFSKLAGVTTGDCEQKRQGAEPLRLVSGSRRLYGIRRFSRERESGSSIAMIVSLTAIDTHDTRGFGKHIALTVERTEHDSV